MKLTCTRLGNESSVETPNNCGNTRISLGVFHTHVRGTENLSISDLQSHMDSKHKIECVGGDGKISCYKRKKIKNFRENILSDIANVKNRCDSIWMGEGSANLITKEVSETAAKFSAELTEKYFDRIRLL